LKSNKSNKNRILSSAFASANIINPENISRASINPKKDLLGFSQIIFRNKLTIVVGIKNRKCGLIRLKY